MDREAPQPSPLLIDDDGKPLERIHGFETEYGVTGISKDVKESKKDSWLTEMVAARATRDPRNLQFTFDDDQNRVYLDCGLHPELSTAEELSFAGSALRVVLGHASMARRHERALKWVLDEYRFNFSPVLRDSVRVLLVANTCDGFGQTWGSHENVLVRRALLPEAFEDALVAHRASRIVWSGAGWPERTDGGGFEFQLSEKAKHIFHRTSNQTTFNRGLLNERDEPHAHAFKFRRIHSIVGETVLSLETNALRIASESVLLRACELGVDFSDLMPEHPVLAMKQISSDPTLRQKVSMRSGGFMTGVQLQRALAERSRQAATEKGYITPQEIEWGNYWIQLLDDLERDPRSRRLDWTAKLGTIERVLKAKRPPNKTDYDIARATALEFHQLLPTEGRGMQLLRAGYFGARPTEEQWKSGIPLPGTRARLRDHIVKRVNGIAGKVARVDWTIVSALSESERSRFVYLPDPYQIEPDNRIENYIKLMTTR